MNFPRTSTRPALLAVDPFMTGAGEPVALPQEPRLLELGVGVGKIVQVEVGDVL